MRRRTASKLMTGSLVGGATVVAALYAARSERGTSPLASKLVVITGGSRGLGLALAEACLTVGAKVALLARDVPELERGRATLLRRGFPPEAIHLFSCDVTNEAQVIETLQLIAADLGAIDVLINNAGVIAVGPIENQDTQSFRHSMDTNFFGAVHTTLAVLPTMLKLGAGQIVNITSIGGLVAVPHLLPYTASKFALVGFSRGITAELKPKGITVLTVCPWLMRTGSHVQALFSGQRSKEYRWFSIGATMPIVSVSARKAARRIILAAETKQTQLLISGWSVLAAGIAQNAPTSTGTILSLVSRVCLPDKKPQELTQVRGFEVRQKEPKIVSFVGKKLASEWNQER